MNNQRAEWNNVYARWSTASLALLSAALLVALLVLGLSEAASAESTSQRTRVAVHTGHQSGLYSVQSEKGPRAVLHSPQITATSTRTSPDCPKLSITKSAHPDLVEPGGELVYTITYGNGGSDPATRVFITDFLPAEVNFISASPPPTMVSGNTLVWDMDRLDPQENGTIVITVTVNGSLPDGYVLTNVVEMDSEQTGPASDTTTTTVASPPELTISKSSHPNPVEPGSTLVYTITYSNIGSGAARRVIIRDTLPAEVSYISASRVPTIFDNTLVWGIRELGPGESGSILATVMVDSPLPDGHVLTNAVEIGCDRTDPVSGTTTTHVISPILAISKTDNPDPVEPGGILVYAIVYSNTGSATAQKVVITDTLPAEVDLISVSPPLTTVSGNVLVWDMGGLDPQENGTIAITVTVDGSLPDGYVLTNVVEMDCERTDPVSDTTTTTVASSPRLTVSKSGHPNLVQPGSTLVYTITYSNTGTTPARGVVITDTLPAEVEFISATLVPAVFGNTLVWDIGTLNPQESRSIVVTAEVKGPLQDGQVLTNVVELSSDRMASISDTVRTNGVSAKVYLPLAVANWMPLCNGGFEDRWACWWSGGELNRRPVTEPVRSGQFAFLLGDPGYANWGRVPKGSGRVWQTFTVPYGNPQVTIWYHIYTHDFVWSEESHRYYDSFEIYINNVDWTDANRSQSDDPQRKARCRDGLGIPDTSAPGLVFCDGHPSKPSGMGSPNDLGWRSVTLDLSLFQGQNITLYMAIFNRTDGWYNTWVYLDDVQVTGGLYFSLGFPQALHFPQDRVQ